MMDRRMLGDIGLAVLLSLPTAVIARQPVTSQQVEVKAQADQQLAYVERSSLRSRWGFLG